MERERKGAQTHEEHVDHDGPGVRGARDRAADAEDLTAEEPPDETDRVLRLVVGRDGNVDVVEGRVGVADGDDGDVDVRRLTDGLVVNARVGDDNQARLLERAGDVVGEVARGEAAGDGLRASVGRKLEDGAVTVRAGRDDADVVRVLDRGNDTRGEDNLLPGLANVDDVDAYIECGSEFGLGVERARSRGRETDRRRGASRRKEPSSSRRSWSCSPSHVSIGAGARERARGLTRCGPEPGGGARGPPRWPEGRQGDEMRSSAGRRES